MKDLKCPAGKKRCPLVTKDKYSEYWCDSNTDIYGFERCPWPKKRAKEIKKRKKHPEDYD